MDDFWSELAALMGGEPMYDWQKDMLIKYITQSPHAGLRTMGRNSPRPGAKILMDLVGKKEDPGHLERIGFDPTTPPPPEVLELYKLGFGKTISKTPWGSPTHTSGFDPSEMLNVIFSPTKYQPRANELGGFSQHGDTFEDLTRGLYQKHLLKPLQGLFPGSYQLPEMDFSPKQMGWTQDVYDAMRGEQRKSQFYSDKYAAQKERGDGLLGGLVKKAVPIAFQHIMGMPPMGDMGVAGTQAGGGGLPSASMYWDDEEWKRWMEEMGYGGYYGGGLK